MLYNLVYSFFGIFLNGMPQDVYEYSVWSFCVAAIIFIVAFPIKLVGGCKE